jgi:2'-5' RNA ligase
MTIRLFIATNFPAALLNDLDARVAELRQSAPSSSWVRPDTQHLTLAFLGEQNEAVVETLVDRIGAAVAPLPRFFATLHGCGFFPNARRARVGWVGIAPEGPFVALAGATRDAIRDTVAALDEKPFRPHLTLVRMREPWPAPVVSRFESVLGGYVSETFSVDTVTLYRSDLRPKGAVHTPLHKFTLA